MPERVWIRETLAGNHDAFANIVERYQRPVFALAVRMLGRREDASDVTQETFLRAFAALPRYETDRPFATWLLSIAANHCLDILRKRKHLAGAVELSEFWPDGQEGPEAKAISAERQRVIQALVRHLAPAYRLVVVLYYWNEMPCAQIAVVTGISEAAVKTRLHRARSLLMRAMTGQQSKGVGEGELLPSTVAGVDVSSERGPIRTVPGPRKPSGRVQQLRSVLHQLT